MHTRTISSIALLYIARVAHIRFCAVPAFLQYFLTTGSSLLFRYPSTHIRSQRGGSPVPSSGILQRSSCVLLNFSKMYRNRSSVYSSAAVYWRIYPDLIKWVFAISIHVPHEGSDFIGSLDNISNPISIHAPTKGATQGDHQDLPSKKHFNPRSHEGSDRKICSKKRLNKPILRLANYQFLDNAHFIF